MKVYKIQAEPTERGERYTIGCENCGHAETYERLLLERPGRTDSIDKPPERWEPATVEPAPELEPIRAALATLDSPRKATPKPRAKPAGRARRR